jgi:hypothetical protein
MHPFLYAGEFQKQSLGGNEYFDNQKVYLVRDGKIVWTLPKSVLGNSSSIHLLDEPGAMEKGDLQR